MRHSKDLYYLIAATLAVRLPWVFMVPTYEAPDENTHYFIIKFMADNLALPGPHDLTAGGQQSVYVPLPHFGYIPHILALWTLSGIFDPSMAPRFGSLLIAPIMTCFAWWLGKQLFPENKLCALAVPTMIVFHPQLVLVHSYSNNDATSSTLATALLCLAVVMIRRGLSFKLSALIGLLCGWLALTKYTGYAVLPAVAFAFLMAAWIHRTALKSLVIYALSALGLTVAIALPWFLRNYQIYNGDYMGTQTMRRHWAALYDKPLEYYVSPLKILVDRKWWRMMYFSYWGMFGYMTRPLIKPLYWTYVAFLAVGIFGLARKLFVETKAGLTVKILEAFRREDRTAIAHQAVWATMFVCTLANLTAMILASTGNVGGPQGRYLFTSEVPFLAGIILGLSLIGKVWGRRLVGTLVFFNVVVYIWSFAMLFPIYGFRWKCF
jgi:4-amino-4-deoxy-L-arabinose transferase-like glycosyltransferase